MRTSLISLCLAVLAVMAFAASPDDKPKPTDGDQASAANRRGWPETDEMVVGRLAIQDHGMQQGAHVLSVIAITGNLKRRLVRSGQWLAGSAAVGGERTTSRASLAGSVFRTSQRPRPDECHGSGLQPRSVENRAGGSRRQATPQRMAGAQRSARTTQILQWSPII